MMKRTVSMIIAICLIAVLVVPFFSITVSAAVNPSIAVPYQTPGLKMFDVSGNSNADEVYISKRSTDFDAVAVAYTDNSNYYVLVCSITSGGICDIRFINSSSGNQFTYIGTGITSTYSYDGNTYYYRNTSLIDWNISNNYIPVYSSFNEAIIAGIDGLNYTPPPPTYTYTFNIPAGYAAYIETNDEITINAKASMPELSSPIRLGDDPWWAGDYACYGAETSVPSLDAIINYDSYTKIPWDKGSDRNLYGQTKTAIWNTTYPYYNLKYKVIYNPAYYIKQNTALPSNSQILSPTVTVIASNVLSVKLIEITGNVVSKVLDVNIDGTTTNNSGNIVTPTPGGGNYIPEESDQTSVLNQLVSGIEQFFTGAWSHIRTLTESISGFPELMGQIFAGLPTEVVSIIVSFFGGH